jgi:hypothetical protein
MYYLKVIRRYDQNLPEPGFWPATELLRLSDLPGLGRIFLSWESVLAKETATLVLPAYSFTCANGICENNCRSMIMFSRRSN